MSKSRLVPPTVIREKHPALTKWRMQYLVRTGQIPCVKISPRRILFDEAEIDRWIKERTRTEVGE